MEDFPPPPLPGPAPTAARPARVPAPRLPGTSAADYGREPDWRRGAVLLGALLALTVAGEIIRAAFALLGGNAIYPDTLDLLRVLALGGLGLALWAGWNWTRWLLAASSFLHGAYLLMWTLVLYAPTQAGLSPGQPAPPHTILMLPGTFLGLAYLAGAGCLALSADVSAFIRHRRERGQAWTLVPLSLLAMAFTGLILSSSLIYVRWLNTQRADAAQFAGESLRAMAQRWDPAAYVERADPDFLLEWPEERRRAAFESLAPLGPLQGAADVEAKSIGTDLDAHGGWFIVRARCNAARADFAHGHAGFSVMVQRPLASGAWRMSDIVVSDIEMEAGAKAPGT